MKAWAHVGKGWRLSALMLAGAAVHAANLACVNGIRRSWLSLDVLLPTHLVLAVAFTLWYAALLSALRGWREVGPTVRALSLAVGVAVAVAHLVMTPRGSIDALTYVVHGYLQVDTEHDLYRTPPTAALDGPLREALLAEGYAAVHTTPSPYGPLWSVIEAAVWRLTGDVRAALRAYQAIGLLSLLACAAALMALLRRRERHGGRRTELAPGAAALALLCSPLAPNEAVLDGHLDVFAYALVLGAFWCAPERRARLLAPLLLAAAISVKIVFVIYLPALVAFGAAGRGLRAVAGLGLAQGALVAACLALSYSLYWRGPETVGALFSHSGNTALTTPLIVAAVCLACAGAARLARRACVDPRAVEPADVTVAATATLTVAYWLPWYGIALVGDLLRVGGRSLWIALYLTLMGRVFTGAYFVAQQHYSARFPWAAELPLPGHVFQAVSLALASIWLATRLVRARRGALRGPERERPGS